MSTDKNSRVLFLLQPDLLTKEELIQMVESRCCRIKNVGLMPKEGLVELFRRVILPLPQRFYRANRRGKILSSRRAKAGLESKRKEEGVKNVSRGGASASDRLKPPPDIGNSRRIRISSDEKPRTSDSQDLSKIIINDRRKSGKEGKKICLKRPGSETSSSCQSTPPTEAKRQKAAIKWP